ncbi:MAG: class I SAM-dependent methyltransferase [Aeromicrobium sp.]
MTTQPGYDELAEAYEEAFPAGYASDLERRAVALLADEISASGLAGPVVDVGCGTGHVTADLAGTGLDVVGVDPSRGMLEIARRTHPDIRFVEADATLDGLDDDRPLAGLLARFSLIHVSPDDVPEVVQGWARRLQPGARAVVAFQCADDPADRVVEFDHRVDRAWRWHPDAMADVLASAGIVERWRLVAQPDDVHRFAECHLGLQVQAAVQPRRGPCPS